MKLKDLGNAEEILKYLDSNELYIDIWDVEEQFWKIYRISKRPNGVCWLEHLNECKAGTMDWILKKYGNFGILNTQHWFFFKSKIKGLLENGESELTCGDCNKVHNLWDYVNINICADNVKNPHTFVCDCGYKTVLIYEPYEDIRIIYEESK